MVYLFLIDNMLQNPLGEFQPSLPRSLLYNTQMSSLHPRTSEMDYGGEGGGLQSRNQCHVKFGPGFGFFINKMQVKTLSFCRF